MDFSLVCLDVHVNATNFYLCISAMHLRRDLIVSLQKFLCHSEILP